MPSARRSAAVRRWAGCFSARSSGRRTHAGGAPAGAGGGARGEGRERGGGRGRRRRFSCRRSQAGHFSESGIEVGGNGDDAETRLGDEGKLGEAAVGLHLGERRGGVGGAEGCEIDNRELGVSRGGLARLL